MNYLSDPGHLAAEEFAQFMRLREKWIIRQLQRISNRIRSSVAGVDQLEEGWWAVFGKAVVLEEKEVPVQFEFDGAISSQMKTVRDIAADVRQHVQDTAGKYCVDYRAEIATLRSRGVFENNLPPECTVCRPYEGKVILVVPPKICDVSYVSSQTDNSENAGPYGYFGRLTFGFKKR